MYTIENNLLHLHLGCHPKWDFCHHKWDCKIPSGVADFSNEFLQKLNQITVKRGGRRGAPARAHPILGGRISNTVSLSLLSF